MRAFHQPQMPFPVAQDDADVVGTTSVLERARRRLVVRRLPLFAAAWLATSATWMVVVTWARPAAFLPFLETGAAQILILGVTIWACRRDPSGPHVRPTVVAAAVALGWSATWGFRVADQPADVLAFVALTLFLAAALLFAWGWRAELVVLVLTLPPALPVMRSLGAAVPLPAFATAILMGAVISLAIAEGSKRAFGTAFLHRQRATERARELEVSRDAYRDLAEKQRDFIYAGDLAGRVTYVNEAFAAFVGEPVASIVGRHFHDFMMPHPDNPDLDAVLASIAAGQSMPPLTFAIRTAGGTRWVEALPSGIEGGDGRVVGVRGIARDVTDRTHAAETLRLSEERFRSAFESASIGMLVVGTDGRATRVNRSLCEMLGYTEAELLGVAFERVTHPDDLELTVAHASAALLGGIQSYHVEKRYRHAHGHTVWGHLSSALVRDVHGEPLYFISQIQDITERKLAEEALRESLADLRRSEERLRLLAQRQAQIREEERKRLGFDLHDNVCQELIGIAILIETLSRRLAPVPPPVAAEFQRVVRYLNELVEHLRVLARDMRPMLLRDLGLEGSLRSLAGGMASPTTRVSAEFPTSIPRFDEDIELAVYRIAQEALANAARHADARTIVVTLTVGAGRLCLVVRDDGCGFDAEPGTHAEALGLVSMRERALALGGVFEVVSAPGEGTVVRLECPLVSRAVA